MQIESNFNYNLYNQIDHNEKVYDYNNLKQAIITDNKKVIEQFVHKADLNYIPQSDLDPLLLLAARHNRGDIMKLLITSGANVNLKNIYGTTALMLVMENGTVDDARMLIENGAHLDLQDNFNETALMWALFHNNMDGAGLLIENKATIDSRDKSGKTALMRAVEEHNIEGARLLIKNGACLDSVDHDNHTSLIIAVKGGNTGTINLLIEKNANVNIQDKKGMTALMWAARNSDYETVALLIKRGADVDTKNHEGNTALMESIDRFFSYAGSKENKQIIKLLIDHSIDLNSQDEKSMTALKRLVLTCSKDNREEIYEIATWLLDKGAKVNEADLDDITPLMWAAKKCDRDTVSFLINKGADMNLVDLLGNTALFWSIDAILDDDSDNKEAVKFLIDSGADLDVIGSNGRTALIWVVENNENDIAKWLLAKGANVNITDLNGLTALMKAVFLNNIPIVKLLAEKTHNLTPALEMAIQFRNHAVLQHILHSKHVEVTLKTLLLAIDKEIHDINDLHDVTKTICIYKELVKKANNIVLSEQNLESAVAKGLSPQAICSLLTLLPTDKHENIRLKLITKLSIQLGLSENQETQNLKTFLQRNALTSIMIKFINESTSDTALKIFNNMVSFNSGNTQIYSSLITKLQINVVENPLYSTICKIISKQFHKDNCILQNESNRRRLSLGTLEQQINDPLITNKEELQQKNKIERKILSNCQNHTRILRKNLNETMRLLTQRSPFKTLTDKQNYELDEIMESRY